MELHLILNNRTQPKPHGTVSPCHPGYLSSRYNVQIELLEYGEIVRLSRNPSSMANANCIPNRVPNRIPNRSPTLPLILALDLIAVDVN